MSAAAAAVAGDATRIGRTLASRLKDLLDRQQYEVIIQVRQLKFCHGRRIERI
jgi:translation elongation factor EF-4